jgi:orotate phosphoribosyltransferase
MPLQEVLSSDAEEEIVVGMFDRGLLGFPPGGIELKSGRVSPYYYNMRGSLSFSRRLDREGRMSLEQQRQFRRRLALGYATCYGKLQSNIFHIFGKAQAATAPAAIGAYEAGMSYLWERVDEPHKTYGYHQKIEGDFEIGDLVGLGDDVVTDGASKVEGAKVLHLAGLQPATITLQFDREEGGVEKLSKEYGFEINSITGLSRAVPILRENRRIGNQEVDFVAQYHSDLAAEGVTTSYVPAA